jgi:hypothetical protein
MSKADLKQSLLDFQTEMKGRLLSDTFEVEGKKWTMQLLTDEEQTWALSMMNLSSALTTGTSGRVANLAIGIRQIDGIDVFDYFESDWDKFSDEEKAAFNDMNSFSLKYFVAEHMHEMLSSMPPEFVDDLWRGWEVLVTRRKDAQAMTKKSSGETSTKTSDEN